MDKVLKQIINTVACVLFAALALIWLVRLDYVGFVFLGVAVLLWNELE